MEFKFLLCSFLFLTLLSGFEILAIPVVNENSENVVWFPNPKYSNGKELIPGNLVFVDSIPKATNLSKVHFYLYTKNNPTNPDELFIGDSISFTNSHFNKNGQLKFMSHGFGGNIDHTFPWDTKGELLRIPENDMNIILLDWHELSGNSDYIGAVVNSYAVSNHSAEFLKYLIVEEKATTLDKVHLIGFSLGGQLVGITAKRFTWFTNLVLPRVTSLDPAFPLFDVAEDDDRISPDDANFVDVIHTAGGTLGMVQPRGHIDFYPNGGSKQPGCGVDLVGSCAHSRAPDFYKESIFGKNQFHSCKCLNWSEFDAGNCTCAETANLGYWIDHTATGKFYLRTNAESPYAIGESLQRS